MESIGEVGKILGLVKTKLGISNPENNDLLEFIVMEIGYRISHFINQDTIPKPLYFTWASMVSDYIQSEHPQLLPGYEEDKVATAIAGLNVKVGDTDISSSSKGGSQSTDQSKRREGTMDRLISNYEIDLIRHRRMRF